MRIFDVVAVLAVAILIEVLNNLMRRKVKTLKNDATFADLLITKSVVASMKGRDQYRLASSQVNGAAKYANDE